MAKKTLDPLVQTCKDRFPKVLFGVVEDAATADSYINTYEYKAGLPEAELEFTDGTIVGVYELKEVRVTSKAWKHSSVKV